MVPDLAERWELSPDNKTYTFYLVKNAKWHDGTAFTADDVIYTFEKMMDPERSVVFTSLEPVKQVVKVDDYTVKVELKEPYVPFLFVLSSTYLCIQGKHTADIDWKSTDYLIGTGPFKFKSFVSGVSYELERNPDYFKKDEDGNQLPYLDGVLVMIMPDENARVNAQISGRLDMCTPGYIQSEDLVDLMKSEVPTMIWRDAPGVSFVYVYINPASSTPLKDANVRRAMVMVADQRAILIASKGTEDVLHSYGGGLFEPTFANPQDVLSKIMGWDKPMEQRIIDAQQLMRDAGYYPEGFKLQLLTVGAPFQLNPLTVLGEAWKKHLNISYEINQIDYVPYVQALSSGDFEVTLYNFVLGSVGDPNDSRGRLTSGSPTNFLGYSDPTIDLLWQKQAAEFDTTKRAEICRQIEFTVMSEYMLIPYPRSVNHLAWWPYVKGFTPPQAYLGVDVENVWLDK